VKNWFQSFLVKRLLVPLRLGINNRDLGTFEVSLNVTVDLLKVRAEGCCFSGVLFRGYLFLLYLLLSPPPLLILCP
jgi:hypothetical protein